MITKGSFLFWEMSDVKTNKEALEALGFGAFVPRNDYKTALIKSLKDYTKGNEKLYRRFNDVGDSVSFSVFIETTEDEELDLRKEITIKLDKKSGVMTGAIPVIEAKFRAEMSTIDSVQLRALILKALRTNSHAIAMRSGGGFYFIDERHKNTLEPVVQLFNSIEGAKLYQIPVYNDSATLEAIEDATASEIFSDIEGLIVDVTREFNNGDLTERKLSTKLDNIGQILKKVKLHEENLGKRVTSVRERIATLANSLEITTKRVASGVEAEANFIECLQAL